MNPYALLDVSQYQGAGIDWQRVKRAGVVGAWVKATEGANLVNPLLNNQTQGARSAGLRVGFYHFARPNSTLDARAEAAHFSTVVRGLTTRRDLKPMLDYETWATMAKIATGSFTLQPAQMVTWARVWNQSVREVSGLTPLFYSFPAFIDHLKPETPIGYGLVLASFGTDDGHEHPYRVPAPWRKAVAHQFTSVGHVPGVPVAVDVHHAPRLRPLLQHPTVGIL